MKFAALGLSDLAVTLSDKTFGAPFVVRVRNILVREELDDQNKGAMILV